MCIGRRAHREEQRDTLARARLVDVNVSPLPDYHRFPDVGQIFRPNAPHLAIHRHLRDRRCAVVSVRPQIEELDLDQHPGPGCYVSRHSEMRGNWWRQRRQRWIQLERYDGHGLSTRRADLRLLLVNLRTE